MLIPDNIEHFNSKGEQLLYIKFKNDSSAKKYYILHSVFTNFHLKSSSGELDFLILVPGHGFFAIEVKHGKVSRVGGTWYYENRNGKVNEDSTGPFQQVSVTMNSIRQYLLGKVSNNPKLRSRFEKILFGNGIAFTSMDENPDVGPEGQTWQMLNREYMRLPISAYISTLSAGWHAEHRRKAWYDVNYSRPTDEDCKTVISILRGDFEVDYSQINKILDDERLIEEYTKEQFAFLDFINYNSRCLVQGPAGTGKTLMAIEVARRSILNNKKVALFCFNQLLGEKLKSAFEAFDLDNLEHHFIGTLHTFLTRNVKSSSVSASHSEQLYFSEVLPFQFLLDNEDYVEETKFDILIVDEAQDLIAEYYLEVFDVILKGGMKSGKWIFFGDFCNQAIYLNEPERSLSLLAEKAQCTNFPPLKINCRNTKKIATQNILLTGASKPEFTSKNIEGLPIQAKFEFGDLAQRESVEQILKELSSSGVPLSKITLLSPKKYENTFLNQSSYVNKLLHEGKVEFFTIQSFKGLENSYVILFGFDGIESSEAQRLLYIGISRARIFLYLILDKSLEESYKRLIQKNVHLTY